MSIIKRIITSFAHRKKCRNLVNRVISQGGYCSKKIRIIVDGTFNCGKNCTFSSEGIDSCGATIQLLFGGHLEVGNNSGFSQSSIICTQSIKIGNNVKIGAGCLIMDSNFHSLDYLKRRNRSTDSLNARREAVTIDDDVFIGARCIVGKGVHIGARTIIASGSVVVNDLPSDCIAGGNPCKIIKRLDL